MNYWTRKLYVGASLLMGLLSSAHAVYVGGNPLSYTDPDGLARIATPGFNNFAEATRWHRKYQDLYVANDAMRERIKKNCPSLLAQFDNWTVSVDPNIDNPVKRSRGFYAFGNFNRQSTQFNKSFFDLGASQGPSQGDVFAHEFRHMMKTNADLFRPGDEMRDPLTVPGEVDADAWARKFWQEKCECAR